jgi:hypothetical protein
MNDAIAVKAMLTTVGYALIPSDGGTFYINSTVTLKGN